MFQYLARYSLESGVLPSYMFETDDSSNHIQTKKSCQNVNVNVGIIINKKYSGVSDQSLMIVFLSCLGQLAAYQTVIGLSAHYLELYPTEMRGIASSYVSVGNVLFNIGNDDCFIIYCTCFLRKFHTSLFCTASDIKNQE